MQSPENQGIDLLDDATQEKTNSQENDLREEKPEKVNMHTMARWLALVVFLAAAVSAILLTRNGEQVELSPAQDDIEPIKSAKTPEPIYIHPSKDNVAVAEVPKPVPLPKNAGAYIQSVFGALDDTNYVAVVEKYEMLHEEGLFDLRLNPNVKGADHNFQLQANEQVVYDATSGLFWQKNGSEKPMKMDPALDYIKSLNMDEFGGFRDWRLPTLQEAIALMQPQRNATGLYIANIFGQKQYWTWTREALPAGFFWIVLYKYGYCGLSSNYSSYDFYVRAVRP
ncbi:MAG: DUF1566 domain-containing protein [Deferribacteres bacterium]|nr:DUF1566 domain-containing protein [candidate division KSB1 bacterium]MCB9511881.1 DUF1566 domain-containing protein [Deferribacteres bacterium]